jgi:hypothetical protein
MKIAVETEMRHGTNSAPTRRGRIMVDRNTAAYYLMSTGRTKTAIFSPTLRLGAKRKVDVKNSSAPFDELVVDGWVANDQFGESFIFEDGTLGDTVSLNLAELKHQMLLTD